MKKNSGSQRFSKLLKTAALSNRKIFHDSGIIFISRVFGSVAHFLGFLLIARVLGINEFGQFSFWFATGLIFSSVIGVGQQLFIQKYLAIQKSRNEIHEKHGLLLFSFVAPTVIYGFLALILLTVQYAEWSALIGGSIVQATLLLGFAYALTEISAAALRVHGKIFASALPKDVIWRSLFPILTFVFTTTVLDASAEGVLYFSSALLFLVWVFQMFLLKGLVSWSANFRFEDLHERLRTAIPYWINSLLSVGGQNLDVVAAGLVLTSEGLAAYFLCSRLMNIIRIPLMAGNAIAAPLVASHIAGSDIRSAQVVVSTVVLFAFSLSASAFIFLFIFGDLVLGVGGPAFRSYYWISILLGSGVLVNVACGPNGIALLMSGHETIYMKVMALNHFIQFALILLFGSLWDIWGVAIVVFCMQCGWNIFCLLFLKNAVGIDTSIVSIRYAFEKPRGEELDVTRRN